MYRHLSSVFSRPHSSKDFLLCVKGCSFKSATTLFTTTGLKSFAPSAHTHWLSLWIIRSPLSCPEYYYTDAKKTPNLSLNTEIKKQQYRKSKNKKQKGAILFLKKKKSLLVIYLPKQNHVHRKKTQHRVTKGNV